MVVDWTLEPYCEALVVSPGSGSSDGKESSPKAEPHSKKLVASTITISFLLTQGVRENEEMAVRHLVAASLLVQFCTAQKCTSPVQCNAANCLDCSCVNGACVCGAGWSGPNCDTAFCYNRTQCNNHGNCDMQVGAQCNNPDLDQHRCRPRNSCKYVCNRVVGCVCRTSSPYF